MTQTLQSVLSSLEQALEDERTALKHFDVVAVEAVTDKKSELADRLAKLLDTTVERPRAERSKLLRMLTGVRWKAEANRALLTDASDLLASVRAMPPKTGTYSRRGCIGKAAPNLERY